MGLLVSLSDLIYSALVGWTKVSSQGLYATGHPAGSVAQGHAAWKRLEMLTTIMNNVGIAAPDQYASGVLPGTQQPEPPCCSWPR